MSANNPLIFTASNATIAPSTKSFDRAIRSKCWITVKSTEDKTVYDLLMERYNKPNRQMTNAVKAAIANGYNKFINDNDWRNAAGDKDHTLSLISPQDISLTWDQYCGCSCPCSPGYRVEFKKGFSPSTKLNIRYDVRYNADIYVELTPELATPEKPEVPFEIIPKEKQTNTDDLFRQSPDAETMQNGGGRIKINRNKQIKMGRPMLAFKK
jgi:hypothetical protein